MRFKDYGPNPKLRKAFVQTKGMLIVGIDIGKAKHMACFGTQHKIISGHFDFRHKGRVGRISD